jgi:large subunit ribosomal protein L21
MYAIVEIAGRQYRVEENKHLVVNRLQAEAGSTIEFNKVLLVGGEKIKVGAPTVAGASVTATVRVTKYWFLRRSAEKVTKK